MNKLLYCATSNTRPAEYQDESVNVVSYDKVQGWQDAERSWLTPIPNISTYRNLVQSDMPGCRVFRIGI